MSDHSARLFNRWLRRPRALVVWAWLWLAARTDSLDEKQRCLDAIPGPDPGREAIHVALEEPSFKETPY